MIERLSNLPTPMQILSDPASIIIISIFLVLLLGEEFFPGRRLPAIRFWRVRGITAFIVYFFLSSYLPLLWNEYLGSLQIFNMTSLGD